MKVAVLFFAADVVCSDVMNSLLKQGEKNEK
jgi:hypothetical protein